MTISIRTRRDVVVVDPDRFLAEARRALRDHDPGLEGAEAGAETDVYEAVHALLDRDGALAADAMDGETVGVGGRPPGMRVHDRPDGLSPAGWLQEIVLDDPLPLQDYGCFHPEDPFALPGPAGGGMRLRMELFVEDLDASVAFYGELLGFEVLRRSEDYVSLRRGAVVLGLGPVAKLPESGPGPGFTQAGLRAGGRGAGVEIVLELDDVPAVVALHERCRAAGVVVAPLQERPWGLRDFRVADPDGYYLRVTHGDAAG